MFGTWDTFLGGIYRDQAHVSIDYPASLWPITGLADPSLGDSIAIGAARLETVIHSTPGPLVIAGTSQGAMVVQRAQADLADDPAIPSDTTFILIADPNLGLMSGSDGRSLALLDYAPQALAETRFQTIVVICQYDGFADAIAHPANLLSVLNALMGLFYIHPWVANSDLSAVPQANISTTVNGLGGVTTTYLVPAQQLPLTMPLRLMGIPESIVDGIDAALRPLVDSGYTRHGMFPAAKNPGRDESPLRTRSQARALRGCDGCTPPTQKGGDQGSGTPRMPESNGTRAGLRRSGSGAESVRT